MPRASIWFAAIVAIGCSSPRAVQRSASGHASGPGSSDSLVRVTGSDTMVNLVQAWAEAYRSVRPDVTVEVAGGGTGVGLAAFADGLTPIAAASREMTEDERRRAARSHVDPIEIAVALDAIAVYVHRTNPLDAITIRQLAEIYGDGGGVERWSQLGVRLPACRSDAIVRVGRQSSSGTYTYFREAILGGARDYKLGSIDQSGSKDVVALVARTPCAIGYSGLAYATRDVKVLGVAASATTAAIVPTVETAAHGVYPLARPLYFYSERAAGPAATAFVDWVLGPAGQRVVGELGFIPVSGGEP